MTEDREPRHGAYNGWCRVQGIPVKAEDCPECVAVTEGSVTEDRETRKLVGVKGHLFTAASSRPAWSCVHCWLVQGEVIQDATFGWCRL